jgi:uncharacterized membrane protein YkvA (DUF1232 family)
MKLSDALKFVGINTKNARKQLAEVREGAEEWIESTGAPAELKRFARKFLRLTTNIDISMTDLAILVGAMLYVLMPCDMIPDIVPFVGWTDDAAVATAALAAIDSASKDASEES